MRDICDSRKEVLVMEDSWNWIMYFYSMRNTIEFFSLGTPGFLILIVLCNNIFVKQGWLHPMQSKAFRYQLQANIEEFKTEREEKKDEKSQKLFVQMFIYVCHCIMTDRPNEL